MRLSSPRIESFLFDEVNEEKFHAHGLTPLQVNQVLDNDHVILPNRQRRTGSYLIIGKDDGGACVAVPVTPTHDPLVWRPVTAWYCKEREKSLLT